MQIDHITFVAKSLMQAQDYAARMFGVALPAGGCHPLMGTHNLLTRIADEVFLEFIAIDPQAPRPKRQRWFALDRLLAEGWLDAGPRLYAWVACLPGLAQRELPMPAMETIEVTRDHLRWHFSLCLDGEASAEGVFPALIDWGSMGSPLGRMTDVGIRLEHFHLAHPDMGALQAQLSALGWDSEAPANRCMSFALAEQTSLALELLTPRGRVKINSYPPAARGG